MSKRLLIFLTMILVMMILLIISVLRPIDNIPVEISYRGLIVCDFILLFYWFYRTEKEIRRLKNSDKLFLRKTKEKKNAVW